VERAWLWREPAVRSVTTWTRDGARPATANMRSLDKLCRGAPREGTYHDVGAVRWPPWRRRTPDPPAGTSRPLHCSPLAVDGRNSFSGQSTTAQRTRLWAAIAVRIPPAERRLSGDSYGSAPGGPQKPITGGYPLHSGRTPLTPHPTTWPPAAKTQVGHELSVVSVRYLQGLPVYSIAGIPSSEPPRLSRRLVGLSHADMADSGICE